MEALDRKYLARDDSPEDIQVVRSKGSFLFDARGRRYIDFTSGWNVGNLGWNNEVLRKAIRSSRAPDYVYPSYIYRPWVELAQMLAGITPGDLQTSYRATGGTEAVEIALQIAMAYTGRRKFLSIEGSYHGNSIGTVSIGDESARDVYPNRLANCHTIDQPLDAKAAARVERILSRRDVAAFILEPIILNLGVCVPDDDFMQRVRKACTRYGTLLVFDEVATGFGRTGRMFAAEHFGIAPDIMTLGKAITGGAAGMGATITTSRIAKAVQGNVSFYSTYGWHPLSVDVALANLRYWRRHGAKLLRTVNELSAVIAARIGEMAFNGGATVRIRGFAIAIEVKSEQYASKIAERCRKKGLLITSDDDLLMLFPALTTERKTIDEALDILASSIR